MYWFYSESPNYEKYRVSLVASGGILGMESDLCDVGVTRQYRDLVNGDLLCSTSWFSRSLARIAR